MAKNKKHLSIFDWLKKIFTAQKKIAILTLLGTLFTIIGAVIAYKSYQRSLPSQISVLYSDYYRGPLKNVNNIAVFHSFIMPYENGQVMLGWDEEGGSYGMPMMANRTSKAIPNLDLKVWMHFPALSIYKRDICPDYEILHFDPENHLMELKYKPNILRAWNAIPIPICTFHQSKPDTNDVYFNGALNIEYSMTYEGAKEPININVLYDVNKDNVLSEEALRWFLICVYSEIYKNEHFSYKKNQWMISVIHGYDYDVFDWPRYGNKDMYDRAKNKLIKKILNNHSITPIN